MGLHDSAPPPASRAETDTQEALPGARPVDAAPASDRPQQDSPRAPRLLIVDDDPRMCRFVGRIGVGLGFEVRTLVHPQQFAATLAEFRPNLLVLDLRMPGTDGIELLRQTRQTAPQTRVILLSGMDQRVLLAAENLGRSSGLDIFAVLQKPIRLHDLEHCLSDAVGPAMLVKDGEIAEALRGRQFVMHYQPKVTRSAGTWLIRSVEALIRWRHPTYGLLLPGQFLPIVERCGLMGDVTDFVLAACFEQIRTWHGEGLDLNVALNIPTETFQDPRFPDHLKELLEAHAVSGSSITLEVTESAAMADPEMAKYICLQLRVNGVGLSIDDFGTGYSSLEQLYDLPFSELKVDRRFVADVTDKDEARTIVRATVNLAHSLGMSACAEGVETEAALAYIEAIGCDAAQGFWISRPLPGDALAGFVTAWNPELVPRSEP